MLAQAKNSHIAFEYIRWHEDLHYAQGLNSTIDMITPSGAGAVRNKVSPLCPPPHASLLHMGAGTRHCARRDRVHGGL